MAHSGLSGEADRARFLEAELLRLRGWSNLLRKFVKPGKPPPECDAGFYRSLYEDLASFSDEQLRAHFQRYGKQEGRIGSPAAHRRGFLATIPKGHCLEIGPFTLPALRGPNVKYHDIMDKAGLLKRAAEHNFPVERPVDIDYVSPTGGMEMIPSASFDVVFSSHCIEHQPDLILHLNEVARVLRRGGAYFLIVPDKRYCFDHFLVPSSIEQVLTAHAERRTTHTKAAVIDHLARITHNDSVRHWCGDHGDPATCNDAGRIAHAERLYEEAAGKYIDVHAWQFEPENFSSITSELHFRKAIGLAVDKVYETVWGQIEFMAVLRK